MRYVEPVNSSFTPLTLEKIQELETIISASESRMVYSFRELIFS